MRRPANRQLLRWRPVGLLLAAGLLAGCASANGAPTPTWVPKPSFGGEGGPNVALPTPNVPSGSGTPSSPRSGPSSPSPTGTNGPDPAIVATNLTTPLGIAVLPDGSALVGERTTGLIVQVQPTPGQTPTKIRTLPGLDASGDGGLLDLALSPNYGEDGLIYAYVTTATDNRVIDFTLTGPATPVLTGIPKGATDNAGRLFFGPDDDLYVGTGDAGTPASAEDPASLAGKILRIDDIGSVPADNPTAGSPVFAFGNRSVDGLCLDGGSGALIEVQTATGSNPDSVGEVTAGGDAASGALSADGFLTSAPSGESGLGGCAVANGVLYLASLTGQSLLAAKLDGTTPSTLKVTSFSATLEKKYGRLRTVVPAPDGSLWLTTSNRDGQGTPGPTDERVLHINPSASGGGGSTL